MHKITITRRSTSTLFTPLSARALGLAVSSTRRPYATAAPSTSQISPSASNPDFTTYSAGNISNGVTPRAANAPRQKQEGTIEDIFTTFTSAGPALPPRFAELKKSLWHEGLVESWRDVLEALEVKTEEVVERGVDNIPQVNYASIVEGLSDKEVRAVKQAGVVIVKGGVPAKEALGWKQSIREYVAANAELVKGSPAGKIVFYELYNTPAQLAARTHPALIATQRALLSLWHSSHSSLSSSPAAVSLTTPIAYFDRLRVRPPGPSAFALDCHIDGGSLERWEDPAYRACYGAILGGDGSKGGWRSYDAFDAGARVGARQDLYHAPVFRPWQGWTSLSSTGPGEGTLRVLPFLALSTAYLVLRPFFRLTPQAERRVGTLSVSTNDAPQIPLGFDDWEVDLDSTTFPGSAMGKAQVLSPLTHPHLRLEKTVVSIPRVEPGDQVYWHCDLVHAVEREHLGQGDSSVLYIPAVPVTIQNAIYLREQLRNFSQGLPPPDFPGGEGEARFTGRATVGDIRTEEGRRMLGIEPYDVPEDAAPGVTETLRAAREILSQESAT